MARERWSRSRSVSVVPTVCFGVLLAIPFARPADAGFPVRFETEEPVAAVTVLGKEHVLDAYLQAISYPGGGPGKSVVGIPIGVLSERCGDGDGCTLRLLMSKEGDDLAVGMTPSMFVTSPFGTKWFVRGFDGTAGNKGSTTDGTSEIIVEIDVDVERRCRFKEDDSVGILGGYFLEAEQLEPVVAAPTCLLRVDD